MTITEQAKAAVEAGITPVKLVSFAARRFDDYEGECILRTYLELNSLELGVLTPAQYRFVARRTKQGEALVERHIAKLFEAYGTLAADSRVRMLTLPVFPKVLGEGKLSGMLFRAFAANPGVDSRRICVEISADVLFEDFDNVRAQIDELRGHGVKIALCEVGDDFCPLARVSAIRPDLVFADSLSLETLQSDDETAPNLVKYLHLGDIDVYAPLSGEDKDLAAAKRAGFEGYIESHPYEKDAKGVEGH